MLLFSQNDFATIYAMTEKYLNFGELAPLYDEYRAILANTPDVEIPIVYTLSQVADNIGKINIPEIMTEPSLENFEKLRLKIHTAHYGSIGSQQRALAQNGFAGSIVSLFGEIDRAIINCNPEVERDQLQEQIDKFISIKPDHRKGALFLGQEQKKGYYYGGHLMGVVVQEVVEN